MFEGKFERVVNLSARLELKIDFLNYL
jgi:hypothetical protein